MLLLIFLHSYRSKLWFSSHSSGYQDGFLGPGWQASQDAWLIHHYMPYVDVATTRFLIISNQYGVYSLHDLIEWHASSQDRGWGFLV